MPIMTGRFKPYSAQAEAEAIVADAKNTQGDQASVIDTIIKEFGQSHSDNG